MTGGGLGWVGSSLHGDAGIFQVQPESHGAVAARQQAERVRGAIGAGPHRSGIPASAGQKDGQRRGQHL